MRSPVFATSRPVAALAASAAALLALSACSDSSSGSGVAVKASETECAPDSTELTAGINTFEVENVGSKGTEIYVLRPNGSTIGERENIGPGTKVKLTVELPAGDYVVRCRPGDIGDGIKTSIKVTGSAKAVQADARIDAAVTAYRAYVAAGSAESLKLTKELQAAIAAGDVAKATSLYAASRVGWESVEPVAEAFGDLDPEMDLREADLEAGQKWTGWHVIEKGLWVKKSTAGLSEYADLLVADLEDLVSRVPGAEMTGTSMANGAKELLDEVATGKITGEEEAFSHTDLVDFQANVTGAKKVYDLLKPVVADAQPDLAKQLDTTFAALQQELDAVRTGPGVTEFPSYDTVDKPTRDKLAAAVDALAEPLSHLAAAVVTTA
jgi:iron uptake system component EfeO